MSMDQGAVFLASSILLMLGFIVIVAGAIAINNLLCRYWKPVKIFHPDSWRGFNPPIVSTEQKNKGAVDGDSTQGHK